MAIIPWKIECLSFRWISPDSNSIHRPAENRTADQTGRENKLRGPRATFTQTTTACRGVGRSPVGPPSLAKTVVPMPNRSQWLWEWFSIYFRFLLTILVNCGPIDEAENIRSYIPKRSLY